MSLLQIYQWVCQWKNFENRLTFGEVMGKSLVSCFFFETQCMSFCLQTRSERATTYHQQQSNNLTKHTLNMTHKVTTSLLTGLFFDLKWPIMCWCAVKKLLTHFDLKSINEILPWREWHSKKLVQMRPILAKWVFRNHEYVVNKWVRQQAECHSTSTNHTQQATTSRGCTSNKKWFWNCASTISS